MARNNKGIRLNGKPSGFRGFHVNYNIYR